MRLLAKSTGLIYVQNPPTASLVTSHFHGLANRKEPSRLQLKFGLRKKLGIHTFIYIYTYTQTTPKPVGVGKNKVQLAVSLVKTKATTIDSCASSFCLGGQQQEQTTSCFLLFLGVKKKQQHNPWVFRFFQQTPSPRPRVNENLPLQPRGSSSTVFGGISLAKRRKGVGGSSWKPRQGPRNP